MLHTSCNEKSLTNWGKKKKICETAYTWKERRKGQEVKIAQVTTA